MSKATSKGPRIDLRPLVEYLGAKQTVHQIVDKLGVESVLQQIGRKKILTFLLEGLSPAERSALRQRLEEQDDRS